MSHKRRWEQWGALPLTGTWGLPDLALNRQRGIKIVQVCIFVCTFQTGVVHVALHTERNCRSDIYILYCIK